MHTQIPIYLSMHMNTDGYILTSTSSAGLQRFSLLRKRVHTQTNTYIHICIYRGLTRDKVSRVNPQPEIGVTLP